MQRKWISYISLCALIIAYVMLLPYILFLTVLYLGNDVYSSLFNLTLPGTVVVIELIFFFTFIMFAIGLQSTEVIKEFRGRKTMPKGKDEPISWEVDI